MATLVCFHAHPDDESIATGGTMAKAAAEGHRVVLVLATGGEHGEVPADLAPGETLAMRRAAETQRSAEALGIARVEFLGYHDSGMTGWEQNGDDRSFMRAPVEEAAAKLAAILEEEHADTLTVYDWHGGYGHPDHIAVHHVGHMAAKLAGTPNLYESTMNRDRMLEFIELGRSMGETIEFDPDDTDDGNPFGSPASEITTGIDVRPFIAQKRASMICHASQIPPDSFFLKMPPEVFETAFGTEWYIHVGAPAGTSEEMLAGLEPPAA